MIGIFHLVARSGLFEFWIRSLFFFLSLPLPAFVQRESIQTQVCCALLCNQIVSILSCSFATLWWCWFPTKTDSLSLSLSLPCVLLCLLYTIIHISIYIHTLFFYFLFIIALKFGNKNENIESLRSARLFFRHQYRNTSFHFRSFVIRRLAIRTMSDTNTSARTEVVQQASNAVAAAAAPVHQLPEVPATVQTQPIGKSFTHPPDHSM